MNIFLNTDRDLYAAKKRIASWASYSDPYMVVLSEQSQFVALEVIVAYLSAYSDGSRRNAFLASHGWAKNFLNLRKGSEMLNLQSLAAYLSRNPRQAALLLESDHILIAREDRVSRLRSAYGFFVGRGCQGLLDMIEGYLNVVYLVEEERRHDAEMASAQKRNRLARLKRLAARVKAIKAQRNFAEVLETVKALLALDIKATGQVAGVGSSALAVFGGTAGITDGAECPYEPETFHPLPDDVTSASNPKHRLKTLGLDTRFGSEFRHG